MDNIVFIDPVATDPRSYELLCDLISELQTSLILSTLTRAPRRARSYVYRLGADGVTPLITPQSFSLPHLRSVLSTAGAGLTLDPSAPPFDAAAAAAAVAAVLEGLGDLGDNVGMRRAPVFTTRQLTANTQLDPSLKTLARLHTCADLRVLRPPRLAATPAPPATLPPHLAHANETSLAVNVRVETTCDPWNVARDALRYTPPLPAALTLEGDRRVDILLHAPALAAGAAVAAPSPLCTCHSLPAASTLPFVPRAPSCPLGAGTVVSGMRWGHAALPGLPPPLAPDPAPLLLRPLRRVPAGSVPLEAVAGAAVLVAARPGDEGARELLGGLSVELGRGQEGVLVEGRATTATAAAAAAGGPEALLSVDGCAGVLLPRAGGLVLVPLHRRDLLFPPPAPLPAPASSAAALELLNSLPVEKYSPVLGGAPSSIQSFIDGQTLAAPAPSLPPPPAPAAAPARASAPASSANTASDPWSRYF